jgi:hypothetical protein
MEPMEIESLRRSLAMLPPKSTGVSREEAMRLLAELQAMQKRIGTLHDGLLALVELCSTGLDRGSEREAAVVTSAAYSTGADVSTPDRSPAVDSTVEPNSPDGVSNET